MKTKNLVIVGIIAIPLLILISATSSLYNQEVKVRNLFKAKMTVRTAFFDNMWKTISGVKDVAVKNDESFQRNVEIIMSNRQDAPDLVMKWIKESNPNANYEQVAAGYRNLSRVIEAKRSEFTNLEKEITSVVNVHDDLISVFPSGVILKTFFGVKPIEYKPITSDRTDEVMRTGKDNNVNVF